MPKKSSSKEDILESKTINSKNEKLVNEFIKLIEYVKIQVDNSKSRKDLMVNTFRLKQIRNALEIIKKYPNEIKKGEDLKEYPGIGKGTISRINEILKTGKLSEIKTSGKEKKYSLYIEDLMKLHGIGHATAYNLVTKYNIKSIDELKKAFNNSTIELNNVIITSLKFYDQYEQNIPREEVDLVKKYLEKKIKLVDKKLEFTICGSYRRLRPTSNDIDVLLYHPKIKTKLQLYNQGENNYLHQFIKILKKDKFLLGDITDKDYEIKYMGYCKYKNKKDYPVRRIDIRYVPYDSLASSLLYFTGSGDFNKKMRRLAEQLGYRLNEYGLYKISDKKKVRIQINSEKDVFDKLGMEYLPPEKRI